MRFLNKRFYTICILLLVAGTIVFAVTTSDVYRDISTSMRLFNEVYRHVILNYADAVKTDEFTELSIRNMVNELDPYSVFLTGDEKDPLETMARGEYGGVGLRISLRNDTLTVISPMEGSPAKRANILPGDQVLKVDSVSTIGMKIDRSTKLIRGKPGTKVQLTIRRPGIGGEMVYSLVRENIDVADVTYTGMVDDGVGYIKLTGFSNGASDEVKKAVTNLTDSGDLNAIILDLRGNPGGLLEEALKISEFFCSQGDTLLFTKGRAAMTNKTFVSKRKPLVDSSIHLAVLIDGGSASASEIVAGIIQDLDRGVVIGTTSFGKGLVQTVYTLDSKHAIKMTTAKYFTPSGRLIQKPDYLNNPKIIEGMTAGDSVFHSKNGRLLKGGGGIAPDVLVSLTDVPLLVRELWRQNMFYSFAIHYHTEHGKVEEVDGKILLEFRQYLKNTGFAYATKSEKQMRDLEKMLKSDQEFKTSDIDFNRYYTVFDAAKEKDFEKNRDLIVKGLTSEFATLEGGLTGRAKSELNTDNVVKQALMILNDQVAYRSTLGFSMK
ncbi:MAG: S41 family peptidase [Candidatus Neomarinimicrobiota bacterium]